MGYKDIAVSIVSGKVARQFKEMEKKHPGVNIYTFIVHTTSITKEDAELIFQHADIATGCASKYIREVGESKKAFKIGDSVPMFGITPRGVHLIQERIKFTGKEIKSNPQAPQPDKLL